MKHYLLFLFLLFSFQTPLFTEDKNLMTLDVALSAECEPLTSVAGCVNVISGSFFQIDTDFVINAVEPQGFTRYYDSNNTYEGFLGHRFSTQFPLAASDPQLHYDHYYAFIPEREGFSVPYKGAKSKQSSFKINCKVDPRILDKGYTNVSASSLSGHANFVNWRAVFKKEKDSVKGWDVKLGDGTHREYSEKVEYISLSQSNPFTRAIHLLKKETKPNGCQVFFDYIFAKNKGRYPKNIKTCNHKGKELSHIRIQYEDTGCILRSLRNDQLVDQLVVYNQSTDKWKLKTKEDKSEHVHKVLTSVVPKHGVATSYLYGKDPNNFLRICEIAKDGVPLLKIKYDSKHRVDSLFEKANASDSWVKTFHFDYGKNKTNVFDAKDQQTIYHFDDEQRLSSIDFIDKTGKSVRKEKFRWSTVGDQKGWLHGKYLALGNQIYHAKVFEYDERGNLKKEIIKGNLTGNGQVSFTLENSILHPETIESNATFYSYYPNNLLESITTQDGVKTTYFYVDDTNLIKAKFVEYDGKIQERLFHEYDINYFLVGIIEDDGSRRDSVDLTDITYRKQKVITPASDPNQLSFGKPQKVSEFCVCNSKLIPLKTTHFTYDYLGYEITQTVCNAQNTVCYTLTSQYNDKHQIASQTNALNEITLYEYDRFGNKAKEVFVDGHKEIHYEYDLNGNLVKKEEKYTKTKESFVFEYTYNSIGQLVEETDPFGNKTNYEYDRLGRQTVCKKPYIETLDSKKMRPIITKNYNIFNCIEEEIDENGHKTIASYTAYGKPLEITYPDGSKERFLYYVNGKMKQKWEADGSSTEYSYDPKGRILCKRNLGPHGFELKKEEYTYKGPFLICKSDPMGVKTFYEYDAAGRKSKETIQNQVTAYEYDDFDRLIKVKRFETESFGQVEVYTYDNLNRITSQELQDFSGILYGKETYEYDRFGHIKKEVVWKNPNEFASSQSRYHSNGDLKNQIDPFGNKTQFSYKYAHINEFGHKVKCTGIQDPMGQMTVELEDPLHRVVRRNYHGNGPEIVASTHYIYSPTGQKLRQEEIGLGRNYTIEWKYNNQGLVESQTEVESGKKVVYQYDAMKRLKEKIKPDGVSLYYTYDRYGNIETLRSSDKTIHYVFKYDLNGNPTEIQDLVQNLVQQRWYDKLNRLVKENLSPGIVLEYRYDPLNRLTYFKLPDNSCIRYEYDAFYLKKVTRIQKDGTILYSYECQERDFQGNLVQAKSPAGVIQANFDVLGRKVLVNSPYFSSQLLNFDPLGNLLSLKQIFSFKEKHENFTYDRFSQITSEAGHQYKFDFLGSCIQKDGKAQIVNATNQLIQDEAATYSYDDNGCLTFVSKPETFYKYDALDRLIASNQEGNKVRYVFDSFGRCLFIKDQSGKAQLLYLGLQEIGSIKDGKMETLRLVHPENCETFAIELKEQVFFPVQDHRHNICALQRIDGSLAQVVNYTAFGEEQLFNESEEIANPWRFANRRNTHGLLLFAHRFYNPKIMRWQTQDPSGYEDGPHLYSYVHNNPLTHFDLFGLQDIDLGEGSFWQTYSAIDFDSFERQADYSSNMLIAYAGAGAAQGFLETHIGMGIGSALNQALVGDTHLGGAQSFYSAGQSVGKVASYTTTLVGLAAQAVTSGVVFVGRIALSKATSYTIDRTKSIASERLNSQNLSNSSPIAGIKEEVAVGKKIWSSTKSQTSVQNALYHWKKHGKEFPQMQNAKQYVENAWNLFKSPPQGTLSKTRPNGELLLYYQKTNTFGSYTKDGIPKTMFRPKDGIKYWETQ